jgi:hypothetical protein
MSLEPWGVEEISATASLNASVEKAQTLLAASLDALGAPPARKSLTIKRIVLRPKGALSVW